MTRPADPGVQSAGAQAAEHPLQHLVGKALPGGTFAFAGYENWLAHDALYSDPEERPHPIMAFIAAQRGLGVSVSELFRMFGSEMADGPLLTESVFEFPGELAPGVRYEVRAEVASVVRKTGRVLGVFDLLTARFELVEVASGEPAAVVTNVYALPRRARAVR